MCYEHQDAQQALLFLILLICLAVCPRSMAVCCIGRRKKCSARGSKRIAVLPLLLVVTASHMRKLGGAWGHIARLGHGAVGRALNQVCLVEAQRKKR